MDNREDLEETEELHELMDEKTEEFDNLVRTHENTERLDDIQMMREKLEIPKDEIHISDIDEDFSDVLKRRQRRRQYQEELPTRSGKRRRLKKWVYLLLLIPLLLGVGLYFIIHSVNEKKRLEAEKALVADIESRYSEYATISKDTKLYEKKDNEYKEIGVIYKDANVELVKEEVTPNTKYFHIKDLDYYISYEDVSKGEKKEENSRYKNYLPFNSNIVTKDSFTLYSGDNKLITINKEMEFPILINNFEDKYYIEYNNMLVNISKDDVSKTKESKNTEKKNQAKMTTLAYHRVFKPENTCTDAYVCIAYDFFDKQMKYLVNNNYFALTLEEYYMYLKGNLQIEKGVVITLDDGLLFVNAEEVLAKYNLKATGFVTTSLGTVFKTLKAIDVQSHTHDMHRNYVCSGGNQGGAMLCASKASIIADLKKSNEILGVEPYGFAYPFYDYNDNVIAALKEAGYKMAFVGRAGVLGKATPKVTDLYKIPRMTVYGEKYMSFNEWKGYL